MRKILEEIIANSKYDTNEEMVGKLWEEMYLAMKREFVYGYRIGVSATVTSARSFGANIPLLEAEGIDRIGEEAWQEREKKLDIPIVSMGTI